MPSRFRIAIQLVVVAFGLAPSAQAADYNLNGATVSITSDALKSDPYKGKTIINGTLNVSANQQFSDGTIIFGSGLVLNQTAGAWQTSGGRTIKVANGGVVNYTSTTDIYIGRLSNGTSYNGTTRAASVVRSRLTRFRVVTVMWRRPSRCPAPVHCG